MKTKYGTPNEVARLEKLVQLFTLNKDNDLLSAYIAKKRNLSVELYSSPKKNDKGDKQPLHKEVLLAGIIAGLPTEHQKTVKS